MDSPPNLLGVPVLFHVSSQLCALGYCCSQYNLMYPRLRLLGPNFSAKLPVPTLGTFWPVWATTYVTTYIVGTPRYDVIGLRALFPES